MTKAIIKEDGIGPSPQQIEAWMLEVGWKNSALRNVDIDWIRPVVIAAVAAEREDIKARLLSMHDSAAGHHSYYAHAAWVLFDA